MDCCPTLAAETFSTVVFAMGNTRTLDLRGQRFGRLLVLAKAHKGERGEIYWLCKCDCGNTKAVRAYTLRDGRTVSCGCYHKERITVHGMTKTRTWKTWDTMLQRCENPKAADYERYGGRGIKIAAEWHEFMRFLSDMGERPNGTTLDRIDVNGNYQPGNCKWSTPSQQQRNRGDAVTATVDGVTKSIWDWADISGIPGGVIQWRLNKGWAPAAAVSKPVRSKHPNRKGLN